MRLCVRDCGTHQNFESFVVNAKLLFRYPLLTYGIIQHAQKQKGCLSMHDSRFCCGYQGKHQTSDGTGFARFGDFLDMEFGPAMWMGVLQ